MGARFKLGFPSVAVLALIYSCGGDATDDDGQGSPSGTLIGTSGGEVTETALTLSIPSGAVSTPVTITVEGTTMVTPPPGLMLVGPAYDLGPDGTTFAKPVLVTIELGSAASGFEQITLYHSSDGASWNPAEGSVFDQPAAEVRGSIRHFSFVAPFASVAISGGGGAPSTGGGMPQAGGSGGESPVEPMAGSGPVDTSAGGVGGAFETGAAAGAGGTAEPAAGAGGAGGAGGMPGVPSYCGDGVVEGGEQCDDGNESNADGCTTFCIVVAICGNGVHEGDEQCDDGNAAVGDGCNTICMWEFCGNGVVDYGEECDDANANANDGCGSTCIFLPICGDGAQEGNEQCDDGNTTNGDGCSSSCKTEHYCGDGVVDSGEQCDHGAANGTMGDACSVNCAIVIPN